MRRHALTLIALAVLAAAPSARAISTYARVLHVYERYGGIAPCQFSSRELETALGSVDTYGAQYFQDFTAAVQTALSARAGGACLPHAAAVASGESFAPLHPGPVTAPTRAGIPAPLVAMAAIAGALLLAAGLRRRGGPWVEAWTHAAAEARLRIGAALRR